MNESRNLNYNVVTIQDQSRIVLKINYVFLWETNNNTGVKSRNNKDPYYSVGQILGYNIIITQ